MTKLKKLPGSLRLCQVCGADISHRSHNAKRCQPCQADHVKAYKRRLASDARLKLYLEGKPAPGPTERLCGDCSQSLDGRAPQAKFCLGCSSDRRKAYCRAYNKRPETLAKDRARQKTARRKAQKQAWETAYWREQSWENSAAYLKRLEIKRAYWRENADAINQERRSDWAEWTKKMEALKHRASKAKTKFREFTVPDYLK